MSSVESLMSANRTVTCLRSPVFAQRLRVSIAQLAEEIRQGVRIQLELPLQGAIGHPAPLAQREGNHLIHKRDKVHPLSPCLAYAPACTGVPAS